MRFHHRRHPRRSMFRRILSFALLLISLAGIVGGLYLLVLVITPSIPALYPVQQIDVKSLPAHPVNDMLYIPKIGISVPIGVGEKALNDGAWHRFPERGDPLIGGNFILAAHRFEIGLTPGETRRKSPFYHIDKLSDGDQILVDFSGKRYGYEITSHINVKPDQSEIEAESSVPKMTLYTCTFGGSTDGRVVYYAKPLGEVINGMVQSSANT